MSGGLFFKLASDNIKKNRKIYAPYILTSIGITMMFYIITSLALDNDLGSFFGASTLLLVLRLGQIVVGAFAIIFLFYTSSFLMKRRKTELGLYSVLGMEKKHVTMVLAWESVIVWVRSVLTGLISGVLFGKLSETLLLRLIGEDINYDFNIDIKAVVITVIFFAAVFAAIFLTNTASLVRANTIELLYSSSKGEKEPRANYILGIGGFVMLVSGYYIAQRVESAIDAVVFFFVAVMLVIGGTFCVMIAGSVALLKTLKKNKAYYYSTNHFISTSSMIFRMKKHGAGLASICILSTMVLVMISSTACLYIGFGDMFDKIYPREVQLNVAFTGPDDNTIENAQAEIEHIKRTAAAENGFIPQNEMKYEVCDFWGEINEGEVVPADCDFGMVKTHMIAVPLEDYNRNSNNNSRLEKNQVYISCKGIRYRNDEITIGTEKYEVKDNLKELEMRGEDVVDIYDTVYIIMPDRESVEKLYRTLCTQMNDKSSSVSLEVYTAFDTDITREGGSKVEFLKTLRDDLYSMADDDFYEGMNYETASVNVQVRTGEEEEGFMEVYGGLFFLGILLSILFTGALIIIMYYKQVTEGYDDCARFEVLRKVGMSTKEIRKTINSQVLTVFFIPLVVTGIHMVFAFHIISLLINAMGVFNNELLIVISAAAFIVFAVIYVIAYKITSGAYYRIVSGSEKLR